MQSLTDDFWQAVSYWACSAKKKPVIGIEVTVPGHNWPEVFRGTIQSFVSGESLKFRLDSGEVLPLDLRNCKVRTITRLKPDKESELEDWIVGRSFSLLCLFDSDEETSLLFTEERDFGEPS